MSADPAHGGGKDLVRWAAAEPVDAAESPAVGPWGEVRPGSVQLFRSGTDTDGDGCVEGDSLGGSDGDATGDGVVVNAQSYDRSTMVIAPGGTVNIDLGRGRGR